MAVRQSDLLRDAMFNRYYDFALCMSFFKIAESFGHGA
jgi:hypothetical protein